MYSKVVKMKILNAIQLKEVDQLTIAAQHISSLELMERASFALTQAIERDLKDVSGYSFAVLCGSGNNGGDGLAVARMLQDKGAAVQVYLLKASRYSDDNLQNQKKFIPILLNPSKQGNLLKLVKMPLFWIVFLVPACPDPLMRATVR